MKDDSQEVPYLGHSSDCLPYQKVDTAQTDLLFAKKMNTVWKHQSFFPSAFSILLSNNKNKLLGSIVFVLSTWLSLCSEITVNRHFQSNINLVLLLILNVLPSEQTVASGQLHFNNGLK